LPASKRSSEQQAKPNPRAFSGPTRPRSPSGTRLGVRRCRGVERSHHAKRAKTAKVGNKESGTCVSLRPLRSWRETLSRCRAIASRKARQERQGKEWGIRKLPFFALLAFLA
jgi:hypothetical protein